MGISKAEILSQLPFGEGFLFVDELIHVHENGVEGSYTFKESLSFYKDHFKNKPVTPAVILTETMAQIGVVCLGIYLLGRGFIEQSLSLAMTSSAIDFLKPVFPGEKVVVKSEKIYFRFNKLSCKVQMQNERGEIICKGTISGMIIMKNHE